MNLSNNLAQIAVVILQDWKNVNYSARPYLEAMQSLNSIHDYYLNDSAASIVSRFLCNAGTWRGPVAKEVKAKLKEML